jgi:hypothetical protein
VLGFAVTGEPAHRDRKDDFVLTVGRFQTHRLPELQTQRSLGRDALWLWSDTVLLDDDKAIKSQSLSVSFETATEFPRDLGSSKIRADLKGGLNSTHTLEYGSGTDLLIPSSRSNISAHCVASKATPLP